MVLTSEAALFYRGNQAEKTDQDERTARELQEKVLNRIAVIASQFAPKLVEAVAHDIGKSVQPDSLYILLVGCYSPANPKLPRLGSDLDFLVIGDFGQGFQTRLQFSAGLPGMPQCDVRVIDVALFSQSQHGEVESERDTLYRELYQSSFPVVGTRPRFLPPQPFPLPEHIRQVYERNHHWQPLDDQQWSQLEDYFRRTNRKSWGRHRYFVTRPLDNSSEIGILGEDKNGYFVCKLSDLPSAQSQMGSTTTI